ncbi:unannotated protein [freshwater metagenome]|uniref:Unannotated protein n=1 Tax=freshwater metagenome TaxID=449393 RepID=A0A6J7FHA9_9ZZZZ|nr:xanthine dehydrogenase family protein subunit M [Actinomycetota bacterium]
MDFRSLRSLDEVLAALAELGDAACVLAGGTDVMVQLGRGEIAPQTLVHIEHVGELSAISCNGHVRLGATATHSSIAESPAILNSYGSLAAAAASVGGWQTQSVGTIGGNIANASPAADLLPPLLVHGAVVSLSSASGSRTLSIDQLLTGRRSTACAADELIVAVDLEPVGARTADAFVKVGRRSAMEVSIVALAVRLTLDETMTTVTDARIALASCGPMAFRATEAEAALIGTTLDDDALRAAGAALGNRAQLIDDVRATAAYRRRLIPRVLGKAVAECRQTIVNRSESQT